MPKQQKLRFSSSLFGTRWKLSIRMQFLFLGIFFLSLFLTLKYQAPKLINYCCCWWLLLQQTKVKTEKELSFSHFIILNWQKPRSTFQIHIKTERNWTERKYNYRFRRFFFLSFFFSPLVEISRHIKTWNRTWKK